MNRLRFWKGFIGAGLLIAGTITGKAELHEAGLQQYYYTTPGNNKDYAVRLEKDLADAGVVGPVEALGAIAADSGSNNQFQNALDGLSYGWNDWGCYAYRGLIYLEEGLQYTFRVAFDDGAIVEIENTLVVTTPNGSSGYNADGWVGTYTPTRTGWFPLRAWVYDYNGGKNKSSKVMSGIQWTTTTDTDALKRLTDATVWNRLQDSGSGDFLRTVVPGSRYVDSVQVSAAVVTATLSPLPSNAKAYLLYDPPTDKTEGILLDDWAGAVYLGTVGTSDSLVSFPLSSLPGTQNTYALALVSEGASRFWEEISEAVNSSTGASVAFSVADISYTNATPTVQMVQLPEGASQATVSLSLAADEAFQSVLWTDSCTDTEGSLLWNPIVTGLAPSTRYWVHLEVTPDVGSTTSKTLSFTTLTPTEPVFELLDTELKHTEIAFSVSLQDTGTIGYPGHLYADVSTSGDYSDATSQLLWEDELDAEAGAEEISVSVTNLPAGETVYVRLRFANEFGGEAILDFGAIALPSPLVVENVAVQAPSAIVVTMKNVANAGIAAKAELFRGDSRVATSSEQDISSGATATASLPLPTLPAEPTDFTLVLTSTLQGATHTTFFPLTLSAKGELVFANSLSEVNLQVFPLGSEIVLPVLARQDEEYTLDNPYVAELDGRFLRLKKPGVATLHKKRDGLTVETSHIVSKPDPIMPNGRFWVGTVSSDFNWWDTGKWVCVSHPEYTGHGYPGDSHASDDQALLLVNFYSSNGSTMNGRLHHNETLRLADFWMANIHPHHHEYRATGANDNGRYLRLFAENVDGPGASILFARSDAKPATFGITGGNCYWHGYGLMFGYDDDNLRNLVKIDCGPAGLLVDQGIEEIEKPWTAEARAARDGFNYSKIRFGKMSSITVREGTSITFVHGNPFDILLSGGVDRGDAKLWIGGKLIGSGDFVNLSPAQMTLNADVTEFSGRIISNMDNAGRSASRSSTFMGYAPTFTNSTASLVLLGNQPMTESRNSYWLYGRGVYWSGCTHQWSANGLDPWETVTPRGDWFFQGGTLAFSYINRAWEPMMTTNSCTTARVEAGTSRLVAGHESTTDTTKVGVEVILKNTVQKNKATLIVDDRNNRERIANSANAGKHLSNVRVEDAAALMTGSTFLTDPTATDYDTIPWMPVLEDDRYLPSAFDADGNVRAAKRATAKDLHKWGENDHAYVSQNQRMYPDTDGQCVRSITINQQGSAWGHFGNGDGPSRWVVTDNFLSLGGYSDVYAGAPGRTDNGTLTFPGTAYVYVGGNNVRGFIWASLDAPYGVSLNATRPVILGGDQTGIGDELVINNGDVTFGQPGQGGELRFANKHRIRLVGGGTKLALADPASIANTELVLQDAGIWGPQIDLTEGDATCRTLTLLAGCEALESETPVKTLPRGTYGSSLSGAEFVDDLHFTGTGILTVRTDDGANATVLFFR